MVSNQVVARSMKGWDSDRHGALLRNAVFGVALMLAGGCAYFKPGEKPTATTTQPASRATTTASSVREEQQTAVDVAIARGDTSPSVVTGPAGMDSGPVLNPNAPKSYTVQRGDTLWGISSLFLRDPWLWPEIWYVNPAVQNPHLIYPGDVLALAAGADGRPQVRLERGGAARVQPLIRSSAIDGPIATIPYAAIASFLGRPSVVSREDADKAPVVVALRDRHVVAGAGHEIYVRGLRDGDQGRYNVVHLGDALKDPKTGKLLGYMGIHTATAQVETTDKLSKARLIESARETQSGDLLFADDVAATTDLIPHAAPGDIDGQIMAVVDGVTLIGQYQVVAINRGSKHGLEPGHVLAIDEAGEIVRDASCRKKAGEWCLGGPKVRLPHERAGTMLVFRTYEQMSYGLTVSLTSPVRVADRVRGP